MRTLQEDTAEVLNLCRLARRAPSSHIAGTLLRLSGPNLPFKLNKIASDAIFFCICGEEAEDATPLDQLSALNPEETGQGFVESQPD